VTDFQDHLMATFREEAGGYVEDFIAGLLSLEQGLEPSVRRELLDELYRKAHSLKGAAQVSGQLATRDLAHQLESAIDAMRRGDVAPDAIEFDPLYGLVDAIGRSVKASALQTVEVDAGQGATQTSVQLIGGGIRETQTTVTVDTSVAESPTPEPQHNEPQRSSAESVRVTTLKLDALFDSAQELLLNVRRTDHWLITLEALHRTIRDWQRSEALALPFSTSQKTANAAPVALTGMPVAAQLALLEQQVATILSTITQDTNTLHRTVGNLQTRVMETRMQPAETLVTLLKRAVRDLSAQTGKPIDFSVQGEMIEVDRYVLDALRDPLIQILRNAVDHGIESPEQRQNSGKSPIGSVALRLSITGNYLRVEASDDGAGMVADDLRSAAVRQGLLGADEAQHVSTQQLVALTTAAGFSTRTQVSDLSGRGMGLNIVQHQIENLHGTLDIHTTPGVGTRLLMQVPITLLTINALITVVRGQTMAIPLTTVSRVLRIDAAQLINLNGRPALATAEGPLPVFALAHLLEMGGKLPERGTLVLLLVGGSRPLALQVDAVEGEQPVVVRQFGYPLRRVRNLSGATLLDDGKPAVILNVTDVLKSTERHTMPMQLAPPTMIVKPPRILVVDDSITTRTLEKQILEHMGYNVATAVNGREALELARKAATSAPFDLLISDMMMPIMNGLQLTEAIRADPLLEHLPVVLVTSMSSPADRQRGMEVGADAYVVKSEFDQEQLIATIQRLIG